MRTIKLEPGFSCSGFWFVQGVQRSGSGDDIVEHHANSHVLPATQARKGINYLDADTNKNSSIFRHIVRTRITQRIPPTRKPPWSLRGGHISRSTREKQKAHLGGRVVSRLAPRLQFTRHLLFSRFLLFARRLKCSTGSAECSLEGSENKINQLKKTTHQSLKL